MNYYLCNAFWFLKFITYNITCIFFQKCMHNHKQRHLPQMLDKQSKQLHKKSSSYLTSKAAQACDRFATLDSCLKRHPSSIHELRIALSNKIFYFFYFNNKPYHIRPPPPHTHWVLPPTLRVKKNPIISSRKTCQTNLWLKYVLECGLDSMYCKFEKVLNMFHFFSDFICLPCLSK